MSDTQREGIQQLLEESGGVLPLGKVMEQFRGLKRAQLEGIFELSKVGKDGQFEVRLPGCDSTGAEIMFQGQPVSKEEGLPALDEISIDLISTLLSQEDPGSTLHSKRIREFVPGVRREQLENHFHVMRIDKKNFCISSEPTVPTIKPPKRQNPRPFQQGGGPLSFHERRIVQKSLDQPVQPLSFDQRGGVQQVLEAAGGVLPLGKLQHKFPGLKRVQLEGFFELSKIGKDGQFEVRLPGCVSAGVEIMVDGQAYSKDDPLPPLDDVSIARIRLELEQAPGFAMPMQKVREIVPGACRQQLESDFQVTRVAKKQFVISLMSDPDDPAAKRMRLI